MFDVLLFYGKAQDFPGFGGRCNGPVVFAANLYCAVYEGCVRWRERVAVEANVIFKAGTRMPASCAGPLTEGRLQQEQPARRRRRPKFELWPAVWA